MATGTDVAMIEAALAIAKLPGITPNLLDVIEVAMLQTSKRVGTVSLRDVQLGTSNKCSTERLEGVFLTLLGSGIMSCTHRDRRGQAFDRFQFEPERLHKILQDAAIGIVLLERLQEQDRKDYGAQLVATLPSDIPLDSETRRNIPTLATVLHRLITEAKQQVIILNPFFEQVGFDRLSSALLAAAARGVTVTVITWQLSELTSVNRKVLGGLAREAAARGLGDRFTFCQYQQIEESKTVLASHAKVLLADDQEAYVGSANLTEYGMAFRLEIGIVLKGPQVKQLKQVLQGILKSDMAIQISKL